MRRDFASGFHTAIRRIGGACRWPSPAVSLVAGSTDIEACDRPSPPCSAIWPSRRAPWSSNCACRACCRRSRIGALLALAGVLLQALFRNPLADSYVLGVSGRRRARRAAGAAARRVAVAGAGSAATGAVLATLLVLALARGGATVRVLLTGVVVASACGALVTLVLVLADNGQLRGMMFWLAGDLGWAARPWIMAGAALLATLAVAPDRAAARRARHRRDHGAEPGPRTSTRWRIVIVDPGRTADRGRRHPGRHHRLHRHGGSAPGAAGLRHGRASRGGAGRGAGRRHLVSRGRPRGAHRGRAAPAAGGRHHGAAGRAGVPGAAAALRSPAPLKNGDIPIFRRDLSDPAWKRSDDLYGPL